MKERWLYATQTALESFGFRVARLQNFCESQGPEHTVPVMRHADGREIARSCCCGRAWFVLNDGTREPGWEDRFNRYVNHPLFDDWKHEWENDLSFPDWLVWNAHENAREMAEYQERKELGLSW